MIGSGNMVTVAPPGWLSSCKSGKTIRVILSGHMVLGLMPAVDAIIKMISNIKIMVDAVFQCVTVG